MEGRAGDTTQKRKAQMKRTTFHLKQLVSLIGELSPRTPATIAELAPAERKAAYIGLHVNQATAKATRAA